MIYTYYELISSRNIYMSPPKTSLNWSKMIHCLYLSWTISIRVHYLATNIETMEFSFYTEYNSGSFACL